MRAAAWPISTAETVAERDWLKNRQMNSENRRARAWRQRIRH
jgi:hypothetical protein